MGPIRPWAQLPMYHPHAKVSCRRVESFLPGSYANVFPSYDLPEDVFEPGEKRPVKAKKGKGAKGAKGAKAVNGMNQAQGGLTPVPRSNEQSPTRVAAIPLSKKRALDNEVRMRSFADYAMCWSPVIE